MATKRAQRRGPEEKAPLASENGVPEGWALSLLPEVVEINPPKRAATELAPDTPVSFAPMGAVDERAGTIARPEVRPFSTVRKGYTAFTDGDVIMAKITPCMENGKAAIARNLMNGLGFGSTEFHVLRSHGAVLPEYVYHYLRQESLRRTAEDEMTGSVGQKRVPRGFLESVRLPVPPLAEQRRIVDLLGLILAKLDSCRDCLERIPGILSRFRQAVLAAACSGDLTARWREQRPHTTTAHEEAELLEKERFLLWTEAMETKARSEGRVLTSASWRSRYARPITVDYDRFPVLPASWRWATFDTFSASSQYGPRFAEAEYVAEGGVPTVRTSDMDFRGRIVFRNPPRVQIAAKALRYLALREDDLLVTRTGATIGKCALFDASLGPAIASAYLIRYRIVRATASPRYLLIVFMSQWGQGHLVRGTTAVAQPNVNTTTIAAIPIPVPPVAEQREIVRRVEALFALAEQVETRLRTATVRAEQLRQAVLARAFRGELVPTEAEVAAQEGRPYESALELVTRFKTRADRASPDTRRRRKA